MNGPCLEKMEITFHASVKRFSTKALPDPNVLRPELITFPGIPKGPDHVKSI
jgi:hypothetical protein